MEIFLDMDGVVANFVAGAFEHHGIPLATDDWLERWPGQWDIMPAVREYGISEAAFWEPLGREFWANLDLTAEAREIVRLATEAAPGRVHFLSSPCHTPGCRDGKYDWLRKHFPNLANNLILCPSKRETARKRSASGKARMVARVVCGKGRRTSLDGEKPMPWTMTDAELQDKLEAAKARLYIAGCVDDGCSPGWWAALRERVAIEREIHRRTSGRVVTLGEWEWGEPIRS